MEDQNNNPIQEQHASSTEAHLLGLPRELRDMILDHLLIKTTNTITMLPNFSCHANEISASQPAVCSVNNQLRTETLPTFYSSNTFTAQLDNEQDLETAKSWLAAIGNQNIRHLRKLTLCGWTRVPFGHMVSKRWVRVTLDLKHGKLVMESRDGDYGSSNSGVKEEQKEVAKSIEELKVAFRNMYEARSGKTFDVRSVGELMDGFNLLCTGY